MLQLSHTCTGDVLAVTVSPPRRPASPQSFRPVEAPDAAASVKVYVIVLGQTGMMYGISVFDDIDSLRLQVCGKRPPLDSRIGSVRFEALEGN